MKKIISVVSALTMAVFFIPTNITAGGYGLAGCGLGSMVLGSKPGVFQVFAATTNGTFANQSFGITFGTSNCSPGSILAKAHNDQKVYAENNFESLKLDMARGEGERLQNLASLMGCSEKGVPALGSLAQTNFDAIYSQNPNADMVLHRVRSLAVSQPQVATSCVLL